MSRKFMAVLLSSALAFGTVSTSAWAANDAANAQVQTTATTQQSPLPPAGAAGIKQAQGIENSPILGLGLVAAFVLVAWLLLDDDEEEESTPGT
jgi:hypothetical protein